MISKILVAIDGSKNADKAFEYASHLAKKTGASLLILHVFEELGFWNLTCTPAHEGQGSLTRMTPFKSKDAASFNLPEFCLLLGRIAICRGIRWMVVQYHFCYNRRPQTDDGLKRSVYNWPIEINNRQLVYLINKLYQTI